MDRSARYHALGARRAAYHEPVQDHAQASPPDRAPTSKVRSAVFYPLLACNARCPFCSTRVYTPDGVVATSDYLKGDTRRGIQAYTLSYEESRERYRGFRDQGVESVNLQGGEPTVWEPLIDLLAYGKELGFKEQIVVTNGRRLADRQFAERLYGSAATAIALSLFGATAALHDESMGVPGAFADMREGVKNLVAIERERREGRQITAQLILHARNFETLPEMIDLWYGEGLRYFCVRLLRETPNTVGAEDQWLFDLALLKEPLERALDRTFALPDLEIVFPELPYCLPDARYTGFVLRDLVANQRLRVEKRVESRHSLSLLTGLRRDTVRAACDACQLGEVCVRVEVAHAPRFSGTLTPVDVPARIEALLAAPPGEADRAIGHVLEATEALRRFGVTEATLSALRARRGASAQVAGLKSPGSAQRSMRSSRILTNLTCNQNCTYCTDRRPVEQRAFILGDAVRARIDAALRGGATELVLTGGEPTLRTDLPALIAHARAGLATAAGSIILETNATLLDAERVQTLRAAGLGAARVNLSGWGEALDEVTRDPGGHARTLTGLRALLDGGVPVEISVVVIRSTLGLLADLPEQLAEALGAQLSGIETIVVRTPVESPNVGELVSYEEAAAAIGALEAAARRVGVAVKLAPDSGPPPCVFPHPSRVAHLYAMTRGTAARADHRKLEVCSRCQMEDRCSGLPAAYLARRAPPPMRPITEDRVRRRLSLISSVEEQIRRELVTHEMLRQPDGTEIPAAIVRINFHCNQACHFCFVSTHLPPPDEADVRAAILAIARRGGVLALSGGEPTLNPQLAEYVRLGKREGARVIELQTNAIRLADATLTRELAEAGVDEALVSLHGSCAAISDSVTAAPGTFEKTARGVDELLACGVRVRLNFVFCDANRADFPAFVALVARRWPAAVVTFSFVGSHTDVVPRTAALIPRYADILPALVAGLDAGRAAGVTILGFESMCGLPLCLVPDGTRQYFALPEITAGADGGEFVKTETCAGCALTSRCWGLRRGYAELHGTGELRAVALPVALG